LKVFYASFISKKQKRLEIQFV